ncbi:MAG: SDR family oxidoreductase [Chloroflexi bacterium]|nr:SDR family oxidoreductase [Chloroflexota bacterium]
MDLGLRSKTVIVTGGASNIGRKISLDFAAEGANVVIADIDDQQAGKVLQEVKRNGGKAMHVKTDVTNLESVEEMVAKAMQWYGTPKALVNVVGWAKPALFLDLDVKVWDRMIAVNYVGALNCIRAVLPHMLQAKGGSIVSIASDAAREGEHSEAVYSGAKAAVVGATKAIAREYGKFGVRLNVVCPGMTVPESTEVIGDHSLWRTGGGVREAITPEVMEKAKKAYPLRRLGRPDDVSNAVMFLASDRAGFITGQTLSVSGGFSMQ